MRLLTVLAAAVAIAILGATSARAATQEISIVGCYFNQGGQTTVPAGTEVVFRVGWADKNRGLVQQFLKAQTTTASIDGNPVANASGRWGSIQKADKKFYVSFWRASAGTLANPGDSTTIALQVTLKKAISGTDENGHHTKFGPGPIFPADFGCKVTAT
jgi:hypothetical protein